MLNKRIQIAVCWLLPLLAMACATVTGAAGSAEKLYGTWANKEYFGTYWTHTFTWYENGHEIWYDQKDVDSPTGEGRFVIDRKWTDKDGYAWYRLLESGSYVPYNEEVAKANQLYSLVRINPQGDVAEIEGSKADWPEAFGELGGTHFIYYRQ